MQPNLAGTTKKTHTKWCVSFLLLVHTLDVTFFISEKLKNQEKGLNFRSPVSTSSIIDLTLYSLPEYRQLAHCTFYRQRLRQSTLHYKVL